jgi:hypothetical protein
MVSQQRSAALLVAALGYVIKFIAYNFLTPVVLLSFAALIFTYINLVGPEIPFFRYLSFLLPIDARGNASIDENDIMKAFGIITLVLFVLAVASGWLLRVLKGAFRRILQPDAEVEPPGDHLFSDQNPLSSAKRRLILSSIVITVIYLVVFLAIPSARMAAGTSTAAMYPIFVVFYVIAMISNVIYIVVDILSGMVLGWAWSRVLNGQESA